jgi:hypothetical protein
MRRIVQFNQRIRVIVVIIIVIRLGVVVWSNSATLAGYPFLFVRSGTCDSEIGFGFDAVMFGTLLMLKTFGRWGLGVFYHVGAPMVSLWMG